MKKRQKIRFGGANPIAGVIYTCAISFALMYTICRQELLICTILMCIAASAVYIALFSLHKRPIGSAVMTLLLTTACFGVIAFISALFMDFLNNTHNVGSSDVGEDSFIYFLFTASAKFSPAHAATAIILFSVVIGFTCCYFSATMPRIGFLLLPALIPLILSTRTSQGLPAWLVMLIVAGYILAACCTAKPLPNDGDIFTDKPSTAHRAAASACLAAAVTLIAAAIPKNQDTIFEQYLNAFSLNSPGFFSGNIGLGNFASRSSVNTGNNSPSDTVLFTVNTNAPTYIDRWSFDVCNGDSGWIYLEEYETGYPSSMWQRYSRAYRPSELFAQLQKGAEDGLLEEYADILLALPKTAPRTGEMLIRLTSASDTRVVLHPSNTYDISIDGYAGDFYRTPRGELFTSYNISAGQYLLSYSVEPPREEYAAAVASLDFAQLLEDAVDAEVISDTTATAFLNEHSLAEGFKRTTESYNDDPEIVQLGRDITKGCANDYEKAAAIERWFGEQGFVYDMEFVPESAEPSYFLFESKRGICSDFATALTLLARGAGLSARYTEGFTLSEDALDENGTYHVTEKNSHAYTQIYIAGCGWVIFDGTRYAASSDSNAADKLLKVILISSAVAAFAAIIILIFRKPLDWALYTSTYPLRSKRSRIKSVFLRTRALACEINGNPADYTSAGEVSRVLTNVLSMPHQAQTICDAANALMYSPDPPNADTKELLRCLKQLRKRRRAMR